MKIELPKSIDDIPKKRTARYPKKKGLNMDEETFTRWDELVLLGREPADLIRPIVKQVIDAAYELATADRERAKLHRKR